MHRENKEDGNGTILVADGLRAIRVAKRESQTTFWKRFGVTQSRGSRFELGMEIPRPVAILVNLYLTGAVNDSDLKIASGYE